VDFGTDKTAEFPVFFTCEITACRVVCQLEAPPSAQNPAKVTDQGQRVICFMCGVGFLKYEICS